MKIQFLRVTDSAQPGFPFMPGQVIAVDHLTPEIREWLKPLKDGSLKARVVEDEPEAAAMADLPETATVKAPVRRTRRR